MGPVRSQRTEAVERDGKPGAGHRFPIRQVDESQVECRWCRRTDPWRGDALFRAEHGENYRDRVLRVTSSASPRTRDGELDR